MSTSQAGSYRLHVLGAPDLRAPDGRRIRSVLSQPKRLGLLTYLALSPGPVTRAAVVAAFWPESDETHARNALSQALFYLRRSLGEDVIRSADGDRLLVPPERVWCDARELLYEDEPSAEVVEAASGALLQGWNADESQPLQEWLDGARRKRAQAPCPVGVAHRRSRRVHRSSRHPARRPQLRAARRTEHGRPRGAHARRGLRSRRAGPVRPGDRRRGARSPSRDQRAPHP